MGYGAEIRNNRKKQGLTQTQLALKVGVSRSAIYLWEAEMLPPTNSKKLAALEYALQLTPGYLYLLIFHKAAR